MRKKSKLQIILQKSLLALLALSIVAIPISVMSYPVGNTIYNPVIKGNMTMNSNTVSGNATWTGTHVFSGATSFGSTVKLKDGTTTTKYLNLASNGNGGTPLTADRTLTFDVYNAARNIDLAGDLTVSGNSSINQNLQTNASPTFESVKFNDDTTTAYNLLIDSDSTVALSADRTLTIDVDNGNRELQLSGNLVVGSAGGTINQDVTTTANPTFSSVKVNDATTPAYDLLIKSDDTGTVKSADRNLNIKVNNADRIIDLASSIKVDSGNTFSSGSLYTNVKSIKKTIGHPGDTDVDFTWTSAENQSEQNINLGALLPAKARIIDAFGSCDESIVGGATLGIGVGFNSSGEEVVASTNIDELNELLNMPAATAPYFNISATNKNIWATGTIGAQNWSTMTAGKWSIYITYIDYANVGS